MVRGIARGWTGAAPTGRAETVAALNAAGRGDIAGGASCVLGQPRCARWHVEDDPMPPTTARGVRIEDREREALGSRRCPSPTENRRDILSGAAESLEDLFIVDGCPRLNIRTGNGHFTCWSVERRQQGKTK